MDICEIGKILREEREKKGLSREDVYRATKISIMNLEAIEEGNIELLPHPVYTRGFIKSYADFLKIDPAPLLDAYEKNCFPSSEKALSKTRKSNFPFENRKKGRIWFLLILLLTLIGITVILFKIREHQIQEVNKKRSFILKEVPETSEVGKKHPPMATNNTRLDHNTKKKQINITGNVTRTSSPQEKNNTNSTTSANSSISLNSAINFPMPSRSSNSSTPSSTKNATSTPQKPSKGHVVKVVATDLCWMKGNMDGNSTREVFLRKGQETTFRFHTHMDLKLGNAGGVNIFLDGNPIPLKARAGEVKTLHFPIKNNE